MISVNNDKFRMELRFHAKNRSGAIMHIDSDRSKRDVDSRALWERPAFRRISTKDAEGGGFSHDEGNPTGGGFCIQPGPGSHSCKNA